MFRNVRSSARDPLLPTSSNGRRGGGGSTYGGMRSSRPDISKSFIATVIWALVSVKLIRGGHRYPQVKARESGGRSCFWERLNCNWCAFEEFPTEWNDSISNGTLLLSLLPAIFWAFASLIIWCWNQHAIEKPEKKATAAIRTLFSLKNIKYKRYFVRLMLKFYVH